MTKTMSPSEVPITVGQIAKFLELQTAALRKSGLPRETTQQILESQGGALADEFVAAVRKRVEAVSNIIVRHVRVKRNRPPEEMLKATGRLQYVRDDVVATMPRGAGEEKDLYFFKRGRHISDDDIQKKDDSLGL